MCRERPYHSPRIYKCCETTICDAESVNEKTKVCVICHMNIDLLYFIFATVFFSVTVQLLMY